MQKTKWRGGHNTAGEKEKKVDENKEIKHSRVREESHQAARELEKSLHKKMKRHKESERLTVERDGERMAI